jgi:hypothetical protein
MLPSTTPETASLVQEWPRKWGTGNRVGVRGLHGFLTRANRLHYTATAKLLHRAGPRAIFAATIGRRARRGRYFRSKRADRLKIVAWDESGLVPFWKRSNTAPSDGPRSATAQLAALLAVSALVPHASGNHHRLLPVLLAEEPWPSSR